MLNHLYKYLRRRGQFQSKFHFLYISLLLNLSLQILHYKTTCTQFCTTSLLYYILIAPHWTVVITSGTWQLNWMENKSMVYTTVRGVISGCCHQPDVTNRKSMTSTRDPWKLQISRQMKGIDYVTETNTYGAFLLFNTPIQKTGFCPERIVVVCFCCLFLYLQLGMVVMHALSLSSMTN